VHGENEQRQSDISQLDFFDELNTNRTLERNIEYYQIGFQFGNRL